MHIKGKNLSYFYKNATTPSLKAVSFEIEKGRLIFFLGRSGSGKTTLLKCLVNLICDFDGSVENLNSHYGFVAQHCHLFPHMTVLQNCVHPQVHVLKRAKAEALKKAENTLETLGIDSLAEKHPSELSGGQQQRVAIARALAMEAELFFLDEPTSALDPQTTQQFSALLKKLRSMGVTIVISTHDMQLVKTMIDKVYLLHEGEVVDGYASSQR